MKAKDIKGWKQATQRMSCPFSVDGLPLSQGDARTLAILMLIDAGVDVPPDLARYLIKPHAVFVSESNSYGYFPLIHGRTEAEWRAIPALRALWYRIRRTGIDRELRMYYHYVDNYETRHSIREARQDTASVTPWPDRFIDRIRSRPLNPVQWKYDRAVGLEFELFGPVGREELANALPLWCQVVSDGSIRPVGGNSPHEVRCLMLRRELEVRLWRVCNKFKDLSLKVNSSCGFHVHIDMRGIDQDAVIKKAKIADAWLYALRELVPLSRRSNNYCKFGVVSPNSNDRYRAVNMTSYPKHKTIEIRLHSGTVDYTKSLAWIRLIELLLALGKKPKAGSCIATLEQLPLADHDLAYWRARHRELNPQMYSDSPTSNEQE